MPKNFHCSGCGGQHKRPVGVKCQFKVNVQADDNSLNSISANSNTDTNVTDTVNHDILFALTSVSSRSTAIEQCIQKTEDQFQKGATSFSDGVNSPTTTYSLHRSQLVDSDVEEEVVTPTTAFLKSSRGIQHAVDRWLQELASLNERCMFKSQ